MPTLDEIKKRFAEDHFATEAAGAEIIEAEPGRAVCAMPVSPRLLNANKVPMGGALFTLADFAFAVAVNGHSDTVTDDTGVCVAHLTVNGFNVGSFRL